MNKSHIRLVETEEFSSDSKILLSNTELDAIKNLLARDPLYGTYVKGLSNKQLLTLDWRHHDKIKIIYLVGVSEDELEIILIAIHSGKSGNSEINAIDKIKERLGTLQKLGFVAIGAIIKKLIDLLF